MREPADHVGLTFRCREALRQEILAAAERNRRSLNAEMIARLEASFRTDNIKHANDEVVEILRDIRELLASMRAYAIN